jgi:AcrR family transcriptional regulator
MREGSVEELSPRQRLLAAADELFYAEGIHTVGIERVLERAGVAKATLYKAYGSKDELVRAYLTGKHEFIARNLAAAKEADAPARDKILAVFDILGQMHAAPSFRGCPFVNASAESPDNGSARDVSKIHRDWVRSLFEELATEGALANAPSLARQLLLLYDGASVAAQLDRDVDAARSARDAAADLIDSGGPLSE